jgi:hypothetical protein
MLFAEGVEKVTHSAEDLGRNTRKDNPPKLHQRDLALFYESLSMRES